MSVQALKIVEEEFLSLLSRTTSFPWAERETLHHFWKRVRERIEKECIEVEDPDDPTGSERERCAKLCESMVVGGRAWDHDQEVAAKALFAAADGIRQTGTTESNATFGYPCQICGKGTVREAVFAHYDTKIGGVPFTVEDAHVGICSECGDQHFSARETKRWHQLFAESTTQVYAIGPHNQVGGYTHGPTNDIAKLLEVVPPIGHYIYRLSKLGDGDGTPTHCYAVGGWDPVPE